MTFSKSLAAMLPYVAVPALTKARRPVAVSSVLNGTYSCSAAVVFARGRRGAPDFAKEVMSFSGKWAFVKGLVVEGSSAVDAGPLPIISSTLSLERVTERPKYTP